MLCWQLLTICQKSFLECQHNGPPASLATNATQGSTTAWDHSGHQSIRYNPVKESIKFNRDFVAFIFHTLGEEGEGRLLPHEPLGGRGVCLVCHRASATNGTGGDSTGANSTSADSTDGDSTAANSTGVGSTGALLSQKLAPAELHWATPRTQNSSFDFASNNNFHKH